MIENLKNRKFSKIWKISIEITIGFWEIFGKIIYFSEFRTISDHEDPSYAFGMTARFMLAFRVAQPF